MSRVSQPKPNNIKRPAPPPCPPPPPSIVFRCSVFGFCETEESKQATQDWLENKGDKMDNEKQYAIEILEQAIKICEDYSIDRYSLYKGRHPYKGNEDGRADNYVNGQSDGAEMCSIMLMDLLEKIKNEI